MAAADVSSGPSRTVASGAESSFEIRVLGPLEILWGGRAIDVGGLKARALIARLLIDRNLVVSVDRLIDSLWSEHPGEGAEIALRSTLAPPRI
jgi:DNA-binding SARP family transcriptional activator